MQERAETVEDLTSLNKEQCVALARRGWSSEDIAEMVGTYPQVVETYLTSIDEW